MLNKMRQVWKRYWRITLLATAVSCAGVERGCASSCASAIGADWLIVQYNYAGQPMACWKLRGESVDNETNSDGIYWKHGSHLVHISGWYNRIQVEGQDWVGAAKLLAIDLDKCQNGAYRPAAEATP